MSRMNCVRGFFVLLVTIGAGGCTRGPQGPTKEIQVPNSGPPVLTSSERTAQELAAKRLTRAVAQASFAQPVDEAPPVKPFEQWSDQEAAADALGRIGPAAVPSLIEALHSQDPAARLKAIEVLGRMGSDAHDAVQELIKLLDDADPAVRKAAARTLGLIGPAANAAVPALMRKLLQPSVEQASPLAR
jgi:HEAT repeat protein